ncbi:MAG: polysaccharide deacetylase family protein [Clostridia bacterium]|nr:polysaccharide deacetylase family protein [Clostridia bacterium]
MAKYLILNADDYGLCKSANDAVEELFRNGRIKSATIMMPCPYAKEAVKFSIENPQFPIGVHLTMTSEWDTYKWHSLSGGKSLEDENGFMWENSTLVGKNAKIDELEKEIRAQVDYAHSLGMKPSHLDNHMGSLYGHCTLRFSLLKMTLRVCGEYGYAFRMFNKTDKRLCPAGVPYAAFRLLKYFSLNWGKKYNVIMPDYMLFPDWNADLMFNGYEHYRDTILKLWTDIPDGVTETFIHPCKESDELKSIVGYWRNRVWEYNVINDPETHRYLEEHGVKLISYRELIEMKSK